MTQLAHDCVLLEIPVDLHKLYRVDDPEYELWLWEVADKVSRTRKSQEKKAKG